MEGFGSADVSTPFHYGSVHDGQYRSDSFEQKLKKQYWKTKQTVIQKLGKNQDEFIVAGDADIDTKLEVRGSGILLFAWTDSKPIFFLYLKDYFVKYDVHTTPQIRGIYTPLPTFEKKRLQRCF